MIGPFGSIMFLLFQLLQRSHWCTPGWWPFMTLTRRWMKLYSYVDCSFYCDPNIVEVFTATLIGGGWISYSSSYPAYQWTCTWWWNLSSREWGGLFNLHWELCGSQYHTATVWNFLGWWNSNSGSFILIMKSTNVFQM